jgi:hypothetical protein
MRIVIHRVAASPYLRNLKGEDVARCHRSLSKPYDQGLSKLLIAFVATGVAFMLLPGTLIGVVNLLTISAKQAPGSADAAWIQAHGHAQIFGWLGTFILGVGFYTIPRLRLSRYSPVAGWTVYALWAAGVTLRVASGMWGWQWRLMMGGGAVLELAAVAIFATSVYLAVPRARDETWSMSVRLITVAGVGFVATVMLNAIESIVIARTAAAPLFPPEFNQRFLSVATWGFVVPYVWGFSTRWLPPLLGLRPTRKSLLIPAVALLFASVALAVGDHFAAAAIGYAIASVVFITAMRLFEPKLRDPKLRGVHPSIGVFARIAYVWLVVAALLGLNAALHPAAAGLVGASRHALTVGFFVVTVFVVGPRVLPAFFGVRRLFSTRLMFVSLLLVNIGCTLRVGAQMLAYQQISSLAWHVLPFSAIAEMIAVFVFAGNLMLSLTTGTPMETYLESQRSQEA